MLFVGKIWIGRNASFADGPHRLIGQDDMAGSLPAHMLQGLARLTGKHVCCDTRFIFAACIANTDKCHKAVGDGGLDLEGHCFIRLIEKTAALTVAKFHQRGTTVFEHDGRHFSGPSTLVIPVHVLRPNMDARAFQDPSHISNVGKRRDDKSLCLLTLRKVGRRKAIGKALRLRPCLVHFPRRADPGNFFDHLLKPVLVWRVQ